MRSSKKRIKLFKTDRTREWATDFLIGVGMFVLVAFFASAHTDSALPASLEKTKAVLERNLETRKVVAEPIFTGSIKPHATGKQSQVASVSAFGEDKVLMLVMGLVFSALLTLTIQFWRNLRRAYASPRRKWRKG